MEQRTNIPIPKILHIGFSDAGLCKEEVLFKCFNVFFLNKLGTRQQGSPDRMPNLIAERKRELGLS